MAKAAVKPAKTPKTAGEPKFPYTTKPASLRRLLQEIPKKPRPPKIDGALLKSWGFMDNNDMSMVRVLKAVGLINATNEPTDLYGQYMMLEGGARTLAAPIKKVYEPLFVASHRPYAEPAATLQNLFNIHSGGSESALEQQIQTFKALCENANFDGAAQPSGNTTARNGTPTSGGNGGGLGQGGERTGGPAININVHIHLPENKTRRDYECMIEDIGRHIFGRTPTGEARDDA